MNLADLKDYRKQNQKHLPKPRPPVVPSEKVGLGWVWRVQIPSEEVLGALGFMFCVFLLGGPATGNLLRPSEKKTQ